MNKIIESHCHLDYLESLPTEEILNKSKEVGVEKILTISVDPKNLNEVVKLADLYPEVFFSQGIHPHDSKYYTEEIKKEILKNSQHKKMLAIGEIGLDYHYDHSPRDIQKEVFKAQLELAIELDKPIIIHTREAEDDTIEILNLYKDQLKRKGVIHSFTSKKYLAEYALKIGFYIGFNGIITFKNAEEVREIVRVTPLNQMLLETDAPFLTPVPHRGKENAPYYLPFIADKIAELKGVSAEEIKMHTYQNSLNLFGF